LVYADNPDRNRRSAGSPKLLSLPHKVAYHPVDLFYHGLRENFYFDPDLHRCDLAATHEEPRGRNGLGMRDCLTKSRIASPRSYPAEGVPEIEDAGACLDKRIQSRRTVQ
jgi:hypothetical protein